MRLKILGELVKDGFSIVGHPVSHIKRRKTKHRNKILVVSVLGPVFGLILRPTTVVGERKESLYPSF